MRSPSKLLVAVVVAFVVLVILLLPALVAYRYTAPAQRGEFVSRPWRGWSFALAALRVPGDARLKTSGMALRKADWLLKGTAVDPREVQLLFVPQDRPYTFTHRIGGRELASTVVPSYRFIWQVDGVIDTLHDSGTTLVALMDYKTGNVLYDVRDDLTPAELTPEPTATPTPTP
jgi:hypothetical protein